MTEAEQRGDGGRAASARRRLLHVALFVIGLVLLDRAIGAGLRAALARASAGELTGRINTVLARALEADVLAFGSSRAAFHVDPRVLERTLGRPALNVGSQGRGILYARMLQALLEERGGRPALVLLQAEPNDVYTMKPERAALFAPYYDESPAIRAILRRTDRFAPLRLASHAYRYNGLIPSLAMGALRPSRFPVETGGLVLGQGSLEGTPPRTPGEVEVGEGTSLEAPQPEALALHREFVRSALDAGSRVLLFTGPRYRQGPPAPLERRALAAFEALARELGVPYRPLTELEHPELRDGALYFDPDHLNERGARRLTELLAREVRVLGLLEEGG